MIGRDWNLRYGDKTCAQHDQGQAKRREVVLEQSSPAAPDMLEIFRSAGLRFVMIDWRAGRAIRPGLSTGPGRRILRHNTDSPCPGPCGRDYSTVPGQGGTGRHRAPCQHGRTGGGGGECRPIPSGRPPGYGRRTSAGLRYRRVSRRGNFVGEFAGAGYPYGGGH